MPRHVRQITFSHTVDETSVYQTVIALCADNTIWETSWNGTAGKWRPWTQLPDIPGEREKTAK